MKISQFKAPQEMRESIANWAFTVLNVKDEERFRDLLVEFIAIAKENGKTAEEYTTGQQTFKDNVMYYQPYFYEDWGDLYDQLLETLPANLTGGVIHATIYEYGVYSIGAASCPESIVRELRGDYAIDFWQHEVIKEKIINPTIEEPPEDYESEEPI